MRFSKLALLGLFLFPLCLCAQNYDDPKFGQVTTAERAMMDYPADTAASAVVLFDRMHVDFSWDPNEGPKLHENYLRRIKLLKSASFDERGNVTIGYSRNSERITGIKAAIHLPDGKTIKIKRGDIVHEKVTDDYGEYKIAYPQITEGAILELVYDKYDDYISILPRYYFQEDIPVMHAEYRANIPEYYRYISLGSNQGLDVATSTTSRVTWGPTFPGQGNDSRITQRNIRYVIKDQPAYESQPYTNNFRDYINQVRLQLQAVVYPGRPVENVFNGWREAANDLHDLAGFGRIYEVGGNYNKVWKEAGSLLEAAATPADKVQAAYNYVANKIKWNGDYGVVAENTPDKVLDAGTGSVADMNLMLVALLREAGVTAHPMLVSLRNAGAPIEFYPIMSQFSTTLAYAEVDGKPMILDVNEADRPAGLPRVRALNHRGWVVDNDNPRWVNIEVPTSSKMMMADITVDAEGMAQVELQGRLKNYYAFFGRDQIGDMEGDAEAPFAEDIVKAFPEAKVTSFTSSVDDKEDTGVLSVDLKMDVPLGAAIDDYLYITPNLIPVLEKELKEVKTRLYPVDFPYPWVERFITTIHVPEGYAVEELPENIVVRTPDNRASVMFASELKADNTISVSFAVNMDKIFYPTEEYEQIRTLFERVIDLQESTIVLKRAK